MKLFVTCMQCIQESKKPPDKSAFVDIRNDGLYEFTCAKGHKSVTALQQQKFEILFEIGAHAILDGYYREAVSSFSASLERFYEFYVKVICLNRDIDEEEIQKTWKEISNQSERQLGTFICAYLTETGHSPTLLSNNWREFRNKVIHKGLIPEKKKAIQYGQTVLGLILPLLNDLKANHNENVQRLVFQHLKRAGSKAPGGITKSTMCITTIVSISSADSSGMKNLEDELSRLAIERGLFGLGI